jgi:histidinol-phosphatase
MTLSGIARRASEAQRIARAAGQHTLRYFSEGVAFERKSDQSPVTLADREAEQIAREMIQASFPDDAILGEEFGEVPGTSGFQWIIDPIDGTKSFIAGVPLYSTLLAVVQGGQSLIGVIYLPALDRGVRAIRGGGAWHFEKGNEDTPARVSNKTRLEESIFVTSQVDSFAKRGAQHVFHALEEKAYVTRTWGDGYGYYLVATGKADLMIDPTMHLWDAAAIAPILDEAGGAFTDWRGEATIHSGEGIGTNKHLLEQVLALTRGVPRQE